MFFFNMHEENQTGRPVPDLFLFFQVLHVRQKQVFSNLVSLISLVSNILVVVNLDIQ